MSAFHHLKSFVNYSDPEGKQSNILRLKDNLNMFMSSTYEHRIKLLYNFCLTETKGFGVL